MPSLRTHFETLGLPPTADLAAVKARFRELALALHPDTSVDPAGDDTRMKDVTAAYAALKTEERLEAYRRQVAPSYAAVRPDAAEAAFGHLPRLDSLVEGIVVTDAGIVVAISVPGPIKAGTYALEVDGVRRAANGRFETAGRHLTTWIVPQDYAPGPTIRREIGSIITERFGQALPYRLRVRPPDLPTPPPGPRSFAPRIDWPSFAEMAQAAGAPRAEVWAHANSAGHGRFVTDEDAADLARVRAAREIALRRAEADKSFLARALRGLRAIFGR